MFRQIFKFHISWNNKKWSLFKFNEAKRSIIKQKIEEASRFKPEHDYQYKQ